MSNLRFAMCSVFDGLGEKINVFPPRKRGHSAGHQGVLWMVYFLFSQFKRCQIKYRNK